MKGKNRCTNQSASLTLTADCDPTSSFTFLANPKFSALLGNAPFLHLHAPTLLGRACNTQSDRSFSFFGAWFARGYGGCLGVEKLANEEMRIEVPVPPPLSLYKSYVWALGFSLYRRKGVVFVFVTLGFEIVCSCF